jgi:hypothetical protein
MGRRGLTLNRREHPVPRTITPEHQQALQEGREAKAEQRRLSRVARVAAWRAWLARDASRFAARRQEELTYEQWRAACREDPEPERPSDKDFKVVDGREQEEEDS